VRARLPGMKSLPQDVASLSTRVLDALPIGLYVVDRDLRIVAWNRLREKGAYGRPREKVLGKHLRQILPAKGYRTTLPILTHVFETGIAHEETTDTPSGRLFHMRRLPVRQGRQITHVLSWFEDITERRALEMKLIASDRLAFLGQAVAGVAHELSNPLAGLSGCAEVLASLAAKAPDATSRREGREFRDLIREEVARCERIVRSLVTTARSDQSTTAALDATVNSALSLLGHHPGFTRIRIRRRFPPDLPPARVDPDSIKQVVVALAVNAARAMEGHGSLTFRGGREHGAVILDVIDTGPGVPRELRSQIFEPFFSGGHGAGLGLAIARSLVRGRGGDLTYRPRRGSGARFRVTLEAAEEGA